MAFSKLSMTSSILIFALFFLAMVAISSCDAEQGILMQLNDHGRLLSRFGCGGKCGYRCSKASRQKLCFRSCTACCRICNCVPPGTAGNREACPCYAGLKNSKGTGKCP